MKRFSQLTIVVSCCVFSTCFGVGKLQQMCATYQEAKDEDIKTTLRADLNLYCGEKIKEHSADPSKIKKYTEIINFGFDKKEFGSGDSKLSLVQVKQQKAEKLAAQEHALLQQKEETKKSGQAALEWKPTLYELARAADVLSPYRSQFATASEGLIELLCAEMNLPSDKATKIFDLFSSVQKDRPIEKAEPHLSSPAPKPEPRFVTQAQKPALGSEEVRKKVDAVLKEHRADASVNQETLIQLLMADSQTNLSRELAEQVVREITEPKK